MRAMRFSGRSVDCYSKVEGLRWGGADSYQELVNCHLAGEGHVHMTYVGGTQPCSPSRTMTSQVAELPR